MRNVLACWRYESCIRWRHSLLFFPFCLLSLFLLTETCVVFGKVGSDRVFIRSVVVRRVLFAFLLLLWRHRFGSMRMYTRWGAMETDSLRWTPDGTRRIWTMCVVCLCRMFFVFLWCSMKVQKIYCSNWEHNDIGIE